MTKRVALVTGGTGGLGTWICRALADAGFRVVAGYNSGGNHDKAKPGRKISVVMVTK